LASSNIQPNSASVGKHLFAYLRALRSSTDLQIHVQSRWPWAAEVILPYPNSLLDRLVLFIKTLHFSVPKKVQEQFFQRSIKSLTIYKHAVKYQLLAHTPTYFHREGKLLSNEKFNHDLLELENVLLQKLTLTPELQENLRDWAGILVDLHAKIRLDALLDFTKSSDQLLRSLREIQGNIQKRKHSLPSLILAADAKRWSFFKKERLVSKQNLSTGSLPGTIHLFRYFVQEKPYEEMDKLYNQIDLAARIWNSSQDKHAYKTLNKLKNFFQRVVEQYGPAWDIANGLAYVNLFKGI
jgi:hypothetical protein